MIYTLLLQLRFMQEPHHCYLEDQVPRGCAGVLMSAKTK